MAQATPGSDYTVQSGDTLTSIAQQAYGDSNQWPEIYNANTQVIGNDPNYLHAGQILFIPVLSPTPGSKYTVQPGDTLFSIAQKAYGDGNKWPEIYNANKQVIGSDPNHIHSGQVLSIPLLTPPPPPPPQPKTCKVTAPQGLNIRAQPNSQSALIASYPIGTVLNFIGVVNGENVNGNPRWGHSQQGHYFWMGGTDHPNG